MRIYFCESGSQDYSRVGHDSVFIDYALKPFGTEVGSSYSSRWYYVDVSDELTEDEAMTLASEAAYFAVNEQVSVTSAVRRFEIEMLKAKQAE